MFRYATPGDVVLMVIGLFAAMVQGAGKCTVKFVNFKGRIDDDGDDDDDDGDEEEEEEEDDDENCFDVDHDFRDSGLPIMIIAFGETITDFSDYTNRVCGTGQTFSMDE